jgi:hypothetical protein
MEEIPDDDNKRNKRTLPEGVPELLMKDEEFKTLQQGEKPIPEPSKLRKNHEKYKITECQPTSSKVKVEDMITDEEERLLEEQDKATTSRNTRSFWDRPTPRPQHDWLHDPRMPDEWNAVVASMRAYEGKRTQPRGEQYRDAREDEISETSEFVDRQPLKLHHPDHRRKQASARLDPWKTDSEQDFKTLRSRFHKPKKPPDMKEEQREEYRRRKGKSRELGLAEEDYPRLRQQWYDEFSDILGGTQDKLPPWREVNHEIHLIDDSKRYHYHLPKVPNSLREQFHEKINRYVNAGWWEPRSVNQAAPMLCLNKKDGRL